MYGAPYRMTDLLDQEDSMNLEIDNMASRFLFHSTEVRTAAGQICRECQIL